MEKHLMSAVFNNHEKASSALQRLNKEGLAKDVSVITNDPQLGELKEYDIKGAASAIIFGAILGGLIGMVVLILIGGTSIYIPGFGTVVDAGVSALLWGSVGATLGFFLGGITGGILKIGFPKSTSQQYEARITFGDMLLLAEVNHSVENKVKKILIKSDAKKIYIRHKAKQK